MPFSLQLPQPVPASIVKFFDLSVKPPRGGWTFKLEGEIIHANSESELIDQVRRRRRNNGTFTTDANIEAELWQYLCSREPHRCGMLPHEVPDSKPLQPRVITKEFQGPPIWAFLNTLAVQWVDGLHPYFLDTCNAIISILECPDCRREWSQIMRETPPTSIRSKLQACKWVNMAHNIVNRRRGAADYSYERMIREWGAPVA